ncbi:LysR family transcriptional regulator [blood disease bacterium A2-HR MARDI]|uniref:LysR family transcriptional regulator n=1 Tax=blood disease bacterium A2-HR MARDI TaxID=1944648 RepID=A0A1U9VHS7_9RALS|nr:LysR family transcriptional regulator [blood disease bacterium A2-HR MARDI]
MNDLYYFVKVVEHGGLTRAGLALGMPKSKLSRRIAALEAQYGVRLLQRSTRHFSVTEIGREWSSKRICATERSSTSCPARPRKGASFMRSFRLAEAWCRRCVC